MIVAVGSTNPVKITCVQLAFEAVWPKQSWEVKGIPVSSDVSNQPLSDEECITGATNRATAAITIAESDFGVGLEGGIQKIGSHWFDKGWIVILDNTGRIGIGSSINMLTPPRMIKMIMDDHLELGEINDIIFKTKNSKHGDGHFGLMTKNLITRTEGYKDAVITALVPFIHPELYE